MIHQTTEGVEFESTEPVKGASVRAWKTTNASGTIWTTCYASAKRWELSGSTVVPVEITEIVEGKSVEKEKEPDWKAMWKDLRGVVAQWSEPKYWKLILDEVQRRHTPREKTAEEKLAEVREHAEKIWSGECAASQLDFAARIMDLCK